MTDNVSIVDGSTVASYDKEVGKFDIAITSRITDTKTAQSLDSTE
ncbi:hypothetical protein [Streptococcus sciuri]|uniref:Uncharacterized protein n=1 Tax=Streptococcus sciuri TaxID=2973939 RepID=A0ABT2F6Q4_9STRE|nr:hypothetical protein [Streptococcus sciuri]MCS4487706.1 hypothetical protein [Streptococcus sciuri]